jgi:mono/diheme cytochrome c family protein
MLRPIRSALLAGTLALLAGCAAPPASEARAADMPRGGELYRTYCIACHTAQVHWRKNRLVGSWEDLRYQVMRWQNLAGQNWSRDEIDDVAAYLNRLFYEVPCPVTGCGGPSLGEAPPRELAAAATGR